MNKLKRVIETGSKLHSLVCDKYDAREKELERQFMQKHNLEDREECFCVCPDSGTWEEHIPALDHVIHNDARIGKLMGLQNHFDEKLESLLKEDQ